MSDIDPRLRDTAFRHAWLAQQVSAGLAGQIQEMRQSRGWSQAEMASRCDMTQEQVSRYENPTYGRFALRTLQRIASVFDVALIVRFGPWSAILTGSGIVWSGAIPSFDEEFGEQVARASAPGPAGAEGEG